jgi:hypothetical protein
MSLRDVHAVTAIPLPCLAALEEGRLDHLPSPVYARGYVRSYAEAVRLDGDRLALELWRLLEDARVEAAAKERPTRPVGTRHRQRRPPMQRPSPLAGLRQPESPWVPKPGRLQRLVPAVERVAIVVLLFVLAVGLWSLEQGGGSRRSPRVAAFETVRPGAPSRSPATTGAATPPAPAVFTPASDNGTQAVYAVGKDHFNVVVKAGDAPCWVDVRSAPGTASLFQGTLQPNEAHPVDGVNRLWIRVGDVAHAAVTVDGVPLTLPDKPAFPYNLLIQG